MKSAAATIYYSEGMIRPVAVRWVSNQALVVCRDSGALELQPNFLLPHTRQFSSASEFRRLESTPKSDALVVIGRRLYQTLRYESAGLNVKEASMPDSTSTLGAFVPLTSGANLAVFRNGELWRERESVRWELISRLATRDITSACALTERMLVVGNSHGEAEIVDLDSGISIRRQRLHADAVQGVLSLGDATMATVSRDRALRIWKIGRTIDLLWSVSEVNAHFINCIARIDDCLWTGCSDGSLALTSISRREKLHTISAHGDAMRALDVSPDGSHVVSVSDDATYCIFDRSGELVVRHGARRQYTRCADLQVGDHTNAVLGTTSGSLRYQKFGESHKSVQLADRPIRAVRYLDASCLIIGDDNGDLHLFSLSTSTSVVVASFGVGVTSLRVDLPLSRLVCGFRDGYIRVFSIQIADPPSQCQPNDESALACFRFALLAERKVHDSIVGDATIDASGLILSCSDDQTLRLVTSDSLATLKSMSLDGTAVNNIVSLGDYLLATTDGAGAYVIDAATHEKVVSYLEHGGPVRAAAHVSGPIVVTGDRAGEVRLWSSMSGDTISTNKFQERVIELGYDPSICRVHVITESEIASLEVPKLWLDAPISDVADLASLKAEVNENRKLTLNSRKKSAFDAATGAQSSSPFHPVSDVELVCNGKFAELSRWEDSLIREFAQKRGGARCSVNLVGGGLSGARVFRVRVFDTSGATRINAIAKIGSPIIIDIESSNYQGEVSRLGPDATPRHLDSLKYGRGEFAGVFYSLADRFDRSHFDIAKKRTSSAEEATNKVRALTAPWREGITESRVDIASIRRSNVDDETLSKLIKEYHLDWIYDFDNHHVQARICTVHGDLHGENILINRNNTPMLIDYGDIRLSTASYDPVTLEFSYFFHPNGPLRDSDWPSPEMATHWRKKSYLEECPIPEIIAGLWEWQDDVSAARREVLVSAYAYLIRQLKYQDTNKERVLAFLNCLLGIYRQT